ncbi:MAG: efflux RND transporter permease subunit [Burkholderiaceae bacterium]
MAERSLYEVFVRRPVATTLLTVGLVLSGLLAVRLLPVAPVPNVEYPTILVGATLPGGSPEIIASTVANPLERRLGTIAGLSEIWSWSREGRTTLSLQFDLDRDINAAAREVQGGINAAAGALPSGMPRLPWYWKANPARSPVLILQMRSDVVGRDRMYDIASTVLAQRIAQVAGVGEVSLSGSSLPAVRVRVNPLALESLGIGAETVRRAIVANNSNRPKGSVEGSERRWQIGANDQARTAADYASLVIAFRNGAPVRLADIAEVTDSVEDVRNVGYADGQPAVLIIVRKEPSANLLDTVERIRALLPSMRASIPATVSLDVAMERTATIRASLVEAQRTLWIAMVLVVLAVLLFLRDARATLVPAIVVPASLAGSFVVMYFAGFSLDNLSLMALTVATGFVVDDAVVVVENIMRHRDRGLSPVDAAIAGVREVGFTVFTISVSLVAVFIPVLAMGGLVGRVLREFSVTLTAAIGVSLLISLTTTPMLCAVLLRAPDRARPPGQLSRAFGAGFDRLQGFYARTLAWALRHRPLMMLVLLAALGLNVYLYTVIPKGFVPRQDTGRLIGYLRADEGSSFRNTRDKLERALEIVQNDRAIDGVVGYAGDRQANRATFFVSLKPLAQRSETPDQVIDRLRRPLSRIEGARLTLVPVQDFRAGGRDSSGEYQFTLFAEDIAELRNWEPKLRRALKALPQLVDVDTDEDAEAAQTRLVVDRDAAARLGVQQRDVSAMLNNYFSQRQVATIYDLQNQYRVVMEADERYLSDPNVLGRIGVVTDAGSVVPLSAVTRRETAKAPIWVTHYRLFASSTISFALAKGVSLSEATALVEDTMARIGMPSTIFGEFAGTAGVFQKSLASQPLLILTALLAIYLVLGILYENLLHPITILSTLPSAGVGALLALLATNTPFTIVAMIAVVLLIGIVKKNAILMIDFALQLRRREGLSAHDAIHRACLVRLRPILMTTLAAVFGALPLAVGVGDGAELRQPFGIAIVGGLLLSQLLTLYTTPVLFLYLDRVGDAALRLLRRYAAWRGESGEQDS